NVSEVLDFVEDVNIEEDVSSGEEDLLDSINGDSNDGDFCDALDGMEIEDTPPRDDVQNVQVPVPQIIPNGVANNTLDLVNAVQKIFENAGVNLLDYLLAQQQKAPALDVEPAPVPALQEKASVEAPIQEFEVSTTVTKSRGTKRKRKNTGDDNLPNKKDSRPVVDLDKKPDDDNIDDIFREKQLQAPNFEQFDVVDILWNTIEVGRGSLMQVGGGDARWHHDRVSESNALIGITVTTNMSFRVPVAEPGQERRTNFRDFEVGDFIAWPLAWLRFVSRE
ncbi:hypothetical protein AKO1_002029, partial [Acrasis kona]